MNTGNILLRPGSLWPAILERTRRALECGALHPIETRFDYIEQSGIRFLIRVAMNLQRKALDQRRQSAVGATVGRHANPFLEPEPELRVADVSETHLALLNKFNVIDYHLLLLTRSYEHQDCLLTPADFAALGACMAEFDALGFYNGGRVAGASQHHKHLQMIPLPMANEGPALPIAPLIESADGSYGTIRLSTLPFPNCFARLDPQWREDPMGAAAEIHQTYLDLMAALAIRPLESDGELRHSAPYNLLIGRDWMLLVPRAREHFRSISINALGFAGSLFVKREAEKEQVREAGPMTVLRAVCAGE